MTANSPTDTAARLSFSVTGMSCNSCAARLEKVLTGTPGVSEAGVNFALGQASLRVAAGTEGAALVRTVRDAGFDVAPSAVSLDIGGMTCAGCAASVEKALRRLPQVADARVNLALERADVDVLDADSDPAPLVRAVEAAGFTARVHAAAGGDDGTPPASGGGGGSARGTLMLALAAILTLPLFAQMVGTAIGVGWHLPAYVAWALATPVQFIVGARFYRGAWRAVRAGSGNMDLLVALGTTTAYAFSVFRVASASPGPLYFEASAIVITLVLFGKWLEERAKRSAAAALHALMALRPETAHVEREGQLVDVPAATVAMREIVVVKPGERIPTDGVIVEGETAVDESLITGESLPTPRGPADAVVGGAVNGTGRLRIRVTAVGSDSTLSRIIRLVENAQTGKAPVQRLVDRVSAVFVPIVVALAVATFLAWWLIGGAVAPAIVAAVSVLVIACPCTLGLATPTALVAGTGVAARAGILVRDIEALERAFRVDTVVFDKTGTLTSGQPRVDEVEARDGDASGLLALAAAVQAGSEHPLAGAVVDAAKVRNIAVAPASHVQAVPGRGVRGTVGGQGVAIGSLAFLTAEGVDTAPLAATAARMHAGGQSLIAIAAGGTALGLIGVRDPLRDDAAAAVQALRRANIETILLSGDAEVVAQTIGRAVGVDRIIAGVDPEAKSDAIAALQAAGRTVAMVGDGLNDAPALARADVGIAMGSGTDVAMGTAGITLMRPQPSLVAAALSVSRATWRKMRQNLFWAFIYNVIGLPLAAAGLLSPVVAGAAMAMSSVSVVTNALTLKTWRPEPILPVPPAAPMPALQPRWVDS